MHRALRLEEVVGVRHSASRAEYRRPYIRRARGACIHVRGVSRTSSLPYPYDSTHLRSPTIAQFPSPKHSNARGRSFTTSGAFHPLAPLTLSARPHRSAVNVVSGSRLIRPDAHYTTLGDQSGWARKRRMGRAGACGNTTGRLNRHCQCEFEPATHPAQRPLLPGPPRSPLPAPRSSLLAPRSPLLAPRASLLAPRSSPRKGGPARSACKLAFAMQN